MEIQEFIHSARRLRGDLLRQARHQLDSEEDAEDAVQETLVKLWMLRDRIPDASKMSPLYANAWLHLYHIAIPIKINGLGST